ncbi:Zn-dependent alcohol dehydrogenase [Pseudarthrobacter sp. NKDBFgelt]|uniref:Zn-dependent alcohol dehydrogenase n=1 Tax=Pseudarthrobacter sp. NKDBFgelt TaxID=3384443 RepID=UPI0038D4C719
MKAAVLSSAPGKLDFEDLILDEPGPHEVLLRTAAVGLCHSDLHYIDGTWSTGLPEVLGHEAAGVVEVVGAEVTSVRPGDHVVSCLTAYCGNCAYCLTGRLALCENNGELRKRERPALSRADGSSVGRMGGLGAFAEHMLVHQNAVVAIDPAMPLDVASVLGCAVITGLGAVFHGAKVRPGATVAVVGCGGVGIAAIQGARLAGAAKVIAVDIQKSALDKALAVGATHAVDAYSGDPVEAVRTISGGGVDYAFEVIGSRHTAEQAFSMLGRGGTATILGMVPDHTPIQIKGSDLFFDEKKIQGSFIGSNRFPVDIPYFVDLYLQGRLHLDDMISLRLPFSKINDGFDTLRGGGVTRIVLDMSLEQS